MLLSPEKGLFDIPKILEGMPLKVAAAIIEFWKKNGKGRLPMDDLMDRAKGAAPPALVPRQVGPPVNPRNLAFPVFQL